MAARRQQRTLAVVGSVGAARGSVFRIVVLQGTVLGACGGLVGAAGGIGLAAAAMAIVDDGAVGTFWGAWGFNVPWLMVGGILLFAVLVGTLAALAPARAATRGDVLAALRGARRPVRGPGPAEPWMWLIAAAAGVLVIGAGAVCLGLARFERRPDDATLTAVGGGRGIRRRINAWQGAIIVGIGVVVGTIAGQIPMWGIAQSGTTMRYWEDAPWVWLAALAVGLPVVVTAASWLVPPRRPELTRRTAIA